MNRRSNLKLAFSISPFHYRIILLKDPLHHKFLEQFKDPLILLLLGSALLSLLIKQYDDAISIFMAVVIVATVSAILKRQPSDRTVVGRMFSVMNRVEHAPRDVKSIMRCIPRIEWSSF